MAVPTWTLAELRDVLGALGVGPSATLLVHASLLHLGRLDGIARTDAADRIIDCILDVLGPDGTLVMPASNWDFGRLGSTFDLQATPPAADLGVLATALQRRTGSVRSANPTFSISALGSRAAWLCGGGNMHNMGFDSAWDRLYRLDAGMLFLGCDLGALSFARYMEMRFGVPYLYNKLFRTPVVDGGVALPQPVVSLLRYADLPVDYDFERFAAALRRRGVLREAPLGGGSARVITMHDCFDAGMDCLKEDVHYFLAGPPQYSPDHLPLA
ncbi:MAG TPA: AAC(3) family N-acetyltransferase [Longimicrobiales bacterium]|nr:AAC(3) family N-acetyltransferase [Longimicrobiales bacterium]